MSKYIEYAVRRIALCVAAAALLCFVVPWMIRDGPVVTAVFGVVLAYAAAAAVLCFAIPFVWDQILQLLPSGFRGLPGVAFVVRRHLARQDGATYEELRYAERLRRPQTWAEEAGVCGLRRVLGNENERARSVSTFPKCEVVTMTPTGPAARYRVAPGTVPSAWEALRLAAELGRAPARLTIEDARTVTISVLTRDPLVRDDPADRYQDAPSDRLPWVDPAFFRRDEDEDR